MREPWEMDSFLQHESTMKSMKNCSGKGRPPVNNGTGCVVAIVQMLLIVAAVVMVIL